MVKNVKAILCFVKTRSFGPQWEPHQLTMNCCYGKVGIVSVISFLYLSIYIYLCFYLSLLLPASLPAYFLLSYFFSPYLSLYFTVALYFLSLPHLPFSVFSPCFPRVLARCIRSSFPFMVCSTFPPVDHVNSSRLILYSVLPVS